MDMQVKKKKVIVGFIVVVLFLGCIVVMQYVKSGSNRGESQATIEGTIIEIQENSILFQDDSGGEYVVYLSEDYTGKALTDFSAGDAVKIWFSGEIAETYPMQITAYKMEKNS